MEKVYIVGAKRTPIGSFLGSLKSVSAVKLASQAIRGALEQAQVQSTDVTEVILGNVLSAGLGQGIARQAAIGAGLSIDVPAYSLNMVCGSGLKAVANGMSMIQSGLAQAVVTGGTESMSNAPFLVDGTIRSGRKMGHMNFTDSMLHDGLTDAFEGYHMGITAENVAREFGISRGEQDQFAIRSQEKAIIAQDSGKFADEIVPVVVETRAGVEEVAEDEYINRTTTLEKMTNLRPVFKADGTVTAANASGLNDGASAIILASGQLAAAQQLPIMAEVIAVGQGGVDPSVMGIGPVPAIKKALEVANLTLADIDLFELNEAFAAQSLAVMNELVDESGESVEALSDRINVNGGAIALGHPIGASGNRILVTLLYELKRRNLTYGLASLCIGGGMGLAVIIKNVED
ncbi:acetyl-CoA acetyltransferase [Dolosigranulum pigrum]|nr:acetyl-CoA C-acetyltransferase [Dolosigranulum pigrum]QTJ47455.1 acetyl-CoA C-acetyltransferase [Dolosigranulum pigrum]QTJ55943.1 acetyl-CoA C-acetyltransferase [Dolosigranulum pigrum]QTJ57672.1 acetyl-CoA C-acetyltransferase [Dolosigranulum pigrum]QTJ60962.1 acetyl-CoA C-acetyltransferase [Dolosigranulum pigrum]RAN56139.1 acetyl-CoA acetyltransferase [Dolosigranulum pigrum]